MTAFLNSRFYAFNIDLDRICPNEDNRDQKASIFCSRSHPKISTSRKGRFDGEALVRFNKFFCAPENFLACLDVRISSRQRIANRFSDRIRVKNRSLLKFFTDR